MKKKLISNQLPEQRALICASALPEIRYNFWFNSEHFPIWFLLVFNGLFLNIRLPQLCLRKIINYLSTCGADFKWENTQTTGLGHDKAQKMSEGRGRKPQEESSGAIYRVSISNSAIIFQNCSQTWKGFV